MCIFKKKSEKTRRTNYVRKSKETSIEIPVLNVDGTGKTSINTSIGFLDHMLTLFGYHGYFDIELKATGDTGVDKHHLNEDIGLSLGESFKKALGECRGIVRTASAEVPMDKVSAKVLVDLSNRPAFKFTDNRSGSNEADIKGEGYSLHLGKDLLESFANKLCINLHVAITGEESGDDALHHYLEAVFKAFGIALGVATRIDPRRSDEIPSSKGIL